MARFEQGLPAAPTEQLISVILDILNFPIVTIALLPSFPRILINGITGWLVFVVNSLLWGWTIYHGGQFLIKRPKD